MKKTTKIVLISASSIVLASVVLYVVSQSRYKKINDRGFEIRVKK